VSNVVAWGSGGYEQWNVPDGLVATAVACGRDFSLALRPEGTVVAWGANDRGQCNVPDGLATAIACGDNHSLALRPDGTVVAWGANDRGQCNVPDGLTGAVGVGTGIVTSFAIMPDGSLVAWGDDGYNQCGEAGGQTNIIRVAGGWVCIAGLRSDGTVSVWGRGYNPPPVRNVPSDLTGVVDVSIGLSEDGGHFALALKSDGSLAAWGNNSGGVCDIPPEATNIIAAKAVPAAVRSIAIRSDGAILDWPIREDNQLIVGWLEGRVRMLAASYTHSLAIVDTEGNSRRRRAAWMNMERPAFF